MVMWLRDIPVEGILSILPRRVGLNLMGMFLTEVSIALGLGGVEKVIFV
jgi:hypothetical protein